MMDHHKLYKLTFRIAGANVEIQSPFRYHWDNLADFFTPQSPDCSIILSEDEVTKEHIMNDSLTDISGWQGFYPTDLVLKKVADALLDFDTFLIHGAAISHKGCGYLFSAPSGTGKTTHIRLWLKNQPDTVVINGDKPFIRAYADKTPKLCGSPWGGKEDMCSNQVSPLKSIVFLHRAEKNDIRQVSFMDVFPQLLQQVYRPVEPVMMRKTLDLIRRLNMSDVTFWQFDCNNYLEDCFQTAYKALTEK